MTLIRNYDCEGYLETRSVTEKSLGRARRHVTFKNGSFIRRPELEEVLEDGGTNCPRDFES